MPRYFNKFPKLLYTKQGNTSLITNLMSRIDVIKGTLDSVSLFYEYLIQEGDTPEIVASKYYNDAELHWVILLFNNMMDPFYDWPMSYQQFQTYIIDKYGSIASAMTTIHHYEKTIQTVDTYSGEKTTNTYIIDLDTYNTVVPENFSKTFNNGVSVVTTISKRAVDCYVYEQELNESKRKIKLIKDDLIPEVKRQFEYLMSK